MIRRLIDAAARLLGLDDDRMLPDTEERRRMNIDIQRRDYYND